MKRILFLLLLAPLTVLAAGGGNVHLDKAPVNLSDMQSLQRGAKVFVNYCLNCHSANYMRYNRLEDIGLTEEQIKDNLVFAADKVGETMHVAMKPADAKQWFGAAPPDLSVVSRSRGVDWLYTYLRGFYRDDSRPLGWNNTVFDKVGMPHVLYQLQGVQELRVEKTTDAHGHEVETKHLELVQPGELTKPEYDALVGDLVNYLAFMGEPAKTTRMTTGILVLLFLGLFFVLAYYLKKEYWKDIH